MHGFVRRWALWGSIAVTLALVAMLGLALDGRARVAARDEVSHEDVGRLLALLRSQDPRRGPPGAVHVLSLRERELDVLLNHVVQRRLGMRVQVALEQGTALVRASTELPAGRWLNLSARIVEERGLPAVVALRVGRVPVPAKLTGPLLRWAAARHEQGADLQAVASMVQRVSLFPQRLSVVYAWDPDATRRALATLLPPGEQLRLRLYQERLAALVAGRPSHAATPLPALLQPLFELARQRTDAGHDAAEENRTALLLLTLHANGRTLEKIVPGARDWPPVAPLRATLAGRDDFALHFLISAAVAIDGTSPLSRALGVYKEVADARRGAGFSFKDIAADRAGTRLGELALTQPRAMQERLAAPLDDAALMPAWSDLPEYLPEAEFQRRFGGVGAPGYERMLAEIDRRIAALPLLR